MPAHPLSNQYIDIHSHHLSGEKEVFRIYNLYVSDIPEATPDYPVSLGIHPWHLSAYPDLEEDLEILKNYSKNDHVLAIGEAGLDKIVRTAMEEQIRVFTIQAKCAEEVEKPLIIHCVRAFQPLLEIRKQLNAGQAWIIHGFNNNSSVAEDLVRQGLYLSVGEKLLRNKEKAQSVIRAIPLSNLFIETDDDDLSLEKIYNAVAQIKGISLQELKESILSNFLNLFK